MIGGRNGAPTSVNDFTDVSRAADQAASLAHTNYHYVSDAKKLAAESPDVAEQVRAGTVTIPQAKAIVDLPPPARARVLGLLAQGTSPLVAGILGALWVGLVAGIIINVPPDILWCGAIVVSPPVQRHGHVGPNRSTLI